MPKPMWADFHTVPTPGLFLVSEMLAYWDICDEGK